MGLEQLRLTNPRKEIREALAHNAIRNPRVRIVGERGREYASHNLSTRPEQFDAFLQEPFLLVEEKTPEQLLDELSQNKIDHFTFVPDTANQPQLGHILEVAASEGHFLYAIHQEGQRQWEAHYDQGWFHANKDLPLNHKVGFLMGSLQRAKQITVIRNDSTYDPQSEFVESPEQFVAEEDKTKDIDATLVYAVSPNDSKRIEQALKAFLTDDRARYVEYSALTTDGRRIPNKVIRDDVTHIFPERRVDLIAKKWAEILAKHVISVKVSYDGRSPQLSEKDKTELEQTVSHILYPAPKSKDNRS